MSTSLSEGVLYLFVFAATSKSTGLSRGDDAPGGVLEAGIAHLAREGGHGRVLEFTAGDRSLCSAVCITGSFAAARLWCLLCSQFLQLLLCAVYCPCKAQALVSAVESKPVVTDSACHSGQSDALSTLFIWRAPRKNPSYKYKV